LYRDSYFFLVLVLLVLLVLVLLVLGDRMGKS